MIRMILVVAALQAAPLHAETAKYAETRCCVEVQRNANGAIKRSETVKRQFRKRWPCPTGASLYEPCPGWQIDHVISLACGGVDAVHNMQWLPVEIKTCASDTCKDRFERKIYCLENK